MNENHYDYVDHKVMLSGMALCLFGVVSIFAIDFDFGVWPTVVGGILFLVPIILKKIS